MGRTSRSYRKWNHKDIYRRTSIIILIFCEEYVSDRYYGRPGKNASSAQRRHGRQNWVIAQQAPMSKLNGVQWRDIQYHKV
jgi:hypothetical protein